MLDVGKKKAGMLGHGEGMIAVFKLRIDTFMPKEGSSLPQCGHLHHWINKGLCSGFTMSVAAMTYGKTFKESQFMVTTY
jgi:hypothetical protein